MPPWWEAQRGDVSAARRAAQLRAAVCRFDSNHGALWRREGAGKEAVHFMTSFASLGITEPILTALTDYGYAEPTVIQEKAIPAGIAGRDVLGSAQTGTGKTCAFGVPILQRLAQGGRGRTIRALILTPTRELAIQIDENLHAYGKNLPLTEAVIFGGVGQAPQVDQLKRGVDILTATPGRLLDLAGQGLLDLCAARPDVVVLDADVAASTRTNWVRDRFPDHFYNLGISEQDLVGTAAGLALGGQIPYVSTYGVFLSGRAFDQIRTTVCYNNLKVRFGGAHAGISVGPDGATHQALEDLALARVLPHMTVIAPCDSAQTRKAVLAAVDWPGPVYFRFGREAVPVITDETTPFTIGKARLVQRGRDCAVLACGAMVYEALVAAQALAAQGISLTVVDLHTIKPLDEAAIQEAARSCGALVTAEEHQLAGGLFGAVSEVVVRTCPVPMEAVAVQDTFGESGPPEALLVRYGLNADAIAQAVRRCLARKG